MLAAQVNVARADLMARNERLEKFEASVHLTPYEVHGERWSLAALDKQIFRRREDSKFVPDRAMRLDLRSLTHFNYSTSEREKAATEVEHLTFIRGEVVRQINQRRNRSLPIAILPARWLGFLKAHTIANSTPVSEKGPARGLSPPCCHSGLRG